jgi:hypothetical protein
MRWSELHVVARYPSLGPRLRVFEGLKACCSGDLFHEGPGRSKDRGRR